MSNNVGPRIFAYFACTGLATVIAFSLGVSHFDSICDENDPEVTECDLGAAYGFFWSFWTLLGCVGAVIVIELVLAFRRNRRPSSPPRQQRGGR